MNISKLADRYLLWGLTALTSKQNRGIGAKPCCKWHATGSALLTATKTTGCRHFGAGLHFFFPAHVTFGSKISKIRKASQLVTCWQLRNRQDHLKLPSPAFIPRAILSSSSVLNRNRRDTSKTLVRTTCAASTGSCALQADLVEAHEWKSATWPPSQAISAALLLRTSSPGAGERWLQHKAASHKVSPLPPYNTGKKDPRRQRCFWGLQPSPAAHLDGTARCYWGKTYDPKRCALVVQASACGFPHLNKMKIIKAIESFLISHAALEKGLKLMQLPSLVRLKNWDCFLKYLWRIH